MRIVVTSGGFDPIHSGHVGLLAGCRRIAEPSGLVMVLLNTDAWLTRKKGKPFMNYVERSTVVNAIRYVDIVTPALDGDDTVVESLREIRRVYHADELIFAKGGDRGPKNTPESDFCRRNGIEIVYTVGGGKTNSSSEILRAWNEHQQI